MDQPNILLDRTSLAILCAAASTFLIGLIAGHAIARLRLSELDLYKVQLRHVLKATFTQTRLMNSSEHRLFRLLEQDRLLKQAGYRIVAQATLGEILKSRHKRAFAAINSKRVDMLILDNSWQPKLAIEYQGEGHFDATSTIRDAIKRSALKKAGVTYLEVFPADKPEKINSLVRNKLGLTFVPTKTGSSTDNRSHLGSKNQRITDVRNC